MVNAIFDVFRLETGEFLEDAELTIYARHIRDLIAYLENIVLTNEQEAGELQTIFAIAQEIGYQVANRQAPIEFVQHVGERLRQELIEIVWQTPFPQLETRELHQRMMRAATVIADYTTQLLIGYNECKRDDQLRQTEQKYNMVLDTLPVTIVVYDEHERCIFVNKTAYESVNKVPADLIGKKRSELRGGVIDSKEPEDVWQRVLAGERVKIRMEFFNEDGRSIHDKEMIPLTDSNRHVHNIITVSYPAVSEKERLYNLQRQFSFVLNSMSSGLLILNRETGVTGFNKKAESIFGVEAESVLGSSLTDLYQQHVGENMEALEYLINVMENGLPIRSLEHSLQVNERKLTLRLDGNPIKNAHGAVVGYILIIDDMTELLAMREAMMRNEKFALIGQFAAGIAHEIRNPLTTVYGFLQLFSQGSVQADYFLDLTQNLLLPEIDRANTILSDFLMVSKPQAPKRSLVDTGKFLADLVR
ncbi:MAG: PAS domain-containing protein, partial [Tumebacillaceae bacterium]